MTVDACPSTRCTTFGSAPPPSHRDGAVCPRSCTRKPGGPVTGPGLVLLVTVIALFGWSAVARVVRAQTLSLRQREFVEAALSLGASDRRIMLLEVLPNVMASVIIYTSLLIPSFVVLGSSLSFLGLGVPPPTPTWGGMLSDSVSYYRQAWWYVVFPVAALLSTTLAFNLFGDSVRDAFDPRAAARQQG